MSKTPPPAKKPSATTKRSPPPAKAKAAKPVAKPLEKPVQDAAPLTVDNSELHVGTKVGPVIVEGVMHLSPFDLTRYELAQHKVTGALQALGMKQRDIELAKRDFEARLAAMGNEATELMQVSQRQQQDLLALQNELAALYSLDFSQVTYDDVSGKIFVHAQPVSA